MERIITLDSFWSCDQCNSDQVKLKRAEPTCKEHSDDCHEDSSDSRHWEVFNAIEKMLENGESLKAIDWLLIVIRDIVHEREF